MNRREREDRASSLSSLEALEARRLMTVSLPAGSIDPSFGDGRMALHAGYAPVGLVVQASGKPVLLERSTANGTMRLFRYTTDGLPDTFGGGDSVDAQLPQGEAEILAQGADGRLLIAGQDAFGNLTLKSFDASGAVDTHFGAGGFTVLQNTSHSSIAALHVVLQQDGKTVYSFSNVLGRLNPDGSPDASFGGSGTVPLAGREDSIAVLHDGRVIEARLDIDLNHNGVLREFTHLANGAIDTSIGTAGESDASFNSVNAITFITDPVSGNVYTLEAIRTGQVARATDLLGVPGGQLDGYPYGVAFGADGRPAVAHGPLGGDVRVTWVPWNGAPAVDSVLLPISGGVDVAAGAQGAVYVAGISAGVDGTELIRVLGADTPLTAHGEHQLHVLHLRTLMSARRAAHLSHLAHLRHLRLVQAAV